MLVAATCLFVVVFLCRSAFGQSQEPDRWEFDLTLYGWLSSVDGDGTVKGQEASVEADFFDILENVDFAVPLHFTASKGRWGFFADVMYMSLSNDDNAEARVGPFTIDIDADIEAQMAIGELGGFYRLFERPLGGNSERMLSFDVLAGGRLWYLEGEIDLELTGPLRNRRRKFDDNKTWVDPVIGGRVGVDLNEKWTLRIRGDIGGFGAGSDFSWNALGAVNWHFGRKWDLVLGYRVLGVDYEDGSGSDKFAIDAVFFGPFAAITYRF
jgi:hypothetical protein